MAFRSRPSNREPLKTETALLLRCPATSQPLGLTIVREEGGKVREGRLTTPDGSHVYPIRDFIPRFVPATNYADSFGMQWNRFRSTQLDSVSGIPISRDRFYNYSKWTAEELKGKRVLDVGCGAGRFAEIALNAGAEVFAVDYSSAVDACRLNFASSDKLEVIQGDVFSLPFEPGYFDYVYCFGVLQHTPNVKRAFEALPRQLKPGGKIVVDVYPWLIRNLGWSKYWFRPITRRLSASTLFKLVERTTPGMLAVSRALARIPIAGHYLRYLVPVASYDHVYPLSQSQLREWAVLDTFDMLSPAHDHPQRRETLLRWLRDAGLEDCAVDRLGFLVGRGTKPLRTIDSSRATTVNAPLTRTGS
jgi:SAM-dependent methyltransferase